MSESDLALLATPEEKVELLHLLEARALAADQANLQDLASFARCAWPILEPGTPLLWNWHLDLICEYLTLVRDRVLRRLIVNVPPQTMKSRLINVLYPTWTWATLPTRRFLSSSYSGDLSATFNVERAKLIKSEWFQRTWPGAVMLTQDRQDQIENSLGGRMTATSTGGTATGKGSHDVIVDDPLNPRQSVSEVELETSNEFFDQTLRTRLSDQITGAFVIVMQRLTDNDLTGHILAKNPDEWTHLKIPMEAEGPERWVFPISGRIVERKEGDLLWTERFPRVVVESLKKTMRWGFAGQHQQRPEPREGGIIKRHWLRFWKQKPEQFDQVVQSWDMSFKDAKDSSRVCGQVWGRLGARRLLLDEVCDQMDFVQTQKAVRSLTSKWPQALAKYVEDKANGPAILSSLREEVSGLIPVEVKGSKEARMFAESPAYEAGNVELPDPSMPGYEWVEEHIAELCRFPNKPNDRGDTASQALYQMRQFPGGVAEYYRGIAEAPKEKAA